MNTLETQLNLLPPGSTIERRAHSWGVKIPSRPGYTSCGVHLEDALEHALGGEAERELAGLEAVRAQTDAINGALFGSPA